jgi:mono/diheme cytochrome c family protein
MKTFPGGLSLLLALCLCFVLGAAAKTGNSKEKAKDASATGATTSHSAQDDTMRLEGEQRFRSNCGRCHAAPPKFPARTMATIIRHMRVRATITDEETHLILHYMTQ